MCTIIHACNGDQLMAVDDTVEMDFEDFYKLLSELNLSPYTEYGTTGTLPLKEFRDALEENWDGWFPEQTILLLKLCRVGLEQGADTISWA